MSGVSGVQNTVNTTNVNFKGKNETRKARKAKKMAAKYDEPLRTHTGTFWGTLSAAVVGIGTLVGRAMTSSKPEVKAIVTAMGAVIAAAYFIGGLFIDRKINKNRAEFEAKRKEIGDDKLLAEQDKHIQFTKNGNAYYKSSVGKKAGLIMGAISSIVPLVRPIMPKSGGLLLNLGAGFITGAVIDCGANRKARKFADAKAAFEASMLAQTKAQIDAEPIADEEQVTTENA